VSSYTTTDLLNSIKRKSFLPAGQSTFTDEELLAIADEQVMNTILPVLVNVREEFLVYHTDYDIVGGKNAYDIPPRAVGMSIREVAIVDGETITTDIRRIEPEQVVSGSQGAPNSFFLKNNQVVLYPTPSTSAKTLRLYYFLRPSRHVESSDAAQVTSIDTGTNTITINATPSGWASGNSFDLIRQDGGQEPITTDHVSVSVAGNDLTFSSLPSTLRVGDYVALAGETPLVQLPAELRSVLAQAVAAEVLEAQNQPGADKAQKTLAKMIDSVQTLLTPRVQGEPRVIINRTWL